MLELYKNIKKKRIQKGWTQATLAERVGYADKTMISRIENGKIDLSQTAIVTFAKALGTSPGELFGESFTKIGELTRIPMLGSICCGNGTFTNQEHNEYFGIDESVDADFCLNVKGNSMINAGICDGDKAFIRKVTDFVDGNIYAVISKGENTASLKKVYRMDQKIMLMPCNSDFDPEQKDSEDVCIVGECVGIYRDF